MYCIRLAIKLLFDTFQCAITRVITHTFREERAHSPTEHPQLQFFLFDFCILPHMHINKGTRTSARLACDTPPPRALRPPPERERWCAPQEARCVPLRNSIQSHDLLTGSGGNLITFNNTLSGSIAYSIERSSQTYLDGCRKEPTNLRAL